MKREDHFVKLILAALLGVGTMGLGSGGLSPRGTDTPELQQFLVADVLCGLSILLILSCLRRGYPAVKVGALLVCFFPSVYIYHSIEKNGRILIREWKKQ